MAATYGKALDSGRPKNYCNLGVISFEVLLVVNNTPVSIFYIKNSKIPLAALATEVKSF